MPGVNLIMLILCGRTVTALQTSKGSCYATSVHIIFLTCVFHYIDVSVFNGITQVKRITNETSPYIHHKTRIVLIIINQNRKLTSTLWIRFWIVHKFIFHNHIYRSCWIFITRLLKRESFSFFTQERVQLVTYSISINGLILILHYSELV
jgi:hypothetical protein